MEKQYEENQKELESLSESLTTMNCQMQIHLKVGSSAEAINFLSAGDPVEVCLVHGLHDPQQVEQRRGVHMPQRWHWATVCACLTPAPTISLYSHTVVTGIRFAMYVMSGSVFYSEWVDKIYSLSYLLKIVSLDHTTKVLNVMFKNKIDCLFVLVLVFRPRLSSEGSFVNFETSLCVCVSAV